MSKLNWMSPKEIDDETKIKNILDDKSLNKSDKAKLLGFKKTTVNLDDKKVSGWVKGEELFLKLSNLIISRKKYPLGFDFYYWGEENYKMKLRDQIRKNIITKNDYFKEYPQDCQECIGAGWHMTTQQPCKSCNEI